MPETASAVATPVPSSTSTAISPGTGGGTSEDVKITYGSPEGDGNVGEVKEQAGDDTQIDGTEGEGSSDVDEFGELDADFEEGDGAAPEKFSSEQYKALKQALAENPELFKAVKREISENSRYKQLHESPEAAREFKDRVESMGGLDAIEEEAKEWSTVYTMFQSGDPGVIDYWAKDNPQALSKLFPHVYDRIAELNPAIWAHKAAGTFMATAQQTGMIAALNLLSKLDAVKKSPEAIEQVNGIIDSLNKLQDIAQKAPTPDLTPEAKALTEREQQLKTQEHQLYIKSLQQDIIPMVTKYGRNALRRVLQGKKLNAEAQKGLLEDVNREYARLSSKDEQFQKNRKALLAAGETEKLKKLVQSHLERTMPMAAKRAWRKYAGISGAGASEAAQRKAEGQSRREAGGGGAAVNMIQSKPPSASEVDWARMKAEFGRDDADTIFAFGKKGVHGGRRFFYKKGDSKNIYTY